MIDSPDPSPSSNTPFDVPDGVEVRGAPFLRSHEILTRGALSFLAELERRLGAERRDLLATREKRQIDFEAQSGLSPDFSADTASVRRGSWEVAECAEDLQCRQVELFGPTTRKIIVSALNSGADVFVADFGDSNSPTWRNMIAGQLHLRDAVRRKIDFVDAESQKVYALGKTTASMFVRPRGLHLEERHVLVDGAPMSAALFDFGLHFFHNARDLLARGSGPYYYLSKLENHLEARFWNEVFAAAQMIRRVRQGTVRATVQIETVPAAFEMDEILYELRDHSAGLQFERSNFVFSWVKRFRARPDCVLPEGALDPAEGGFLSQFETLCVETCQRRSAQVIGGLSADVPIPRDPDLNYSAQQHVRGEKRREAELGLDGSAVAHPAFVTVVREEFVSAARSQEGTKLGSHLSAETPTVAAESLFRGASDVVVTERGLRDSLRLCVSYFEAWIRGFGNVCLDDRMVDTRTAEAARGWVWHCLKHSVKTDDGRVVDGAMIRNLLEEEVAQARSLVDSDDLESQRFDVAKRLLGELLGDDVLADSAVVSFASHLDEPVSV